MASTSIASHSLSLFPDRQDLLDNEALPDREDLPDWEDLRERQG